MFDARYLSTELKVDKGFRTRGLCIDSVSGTIEGPAGIEHVDPRVMAVFVALARRSGRLVTREQLLDEIWSGRVVGDETLTQCVYQLRCHLEAAGGHSRYRKLIETTPKRGYRLVGKVKPVESSAVAGPLQAIARLSRQHMVFAVFLMVASLAGIYFAFDRLNRTNGAEFIPSATIAVLPFDDFSPNGDQAYLASGFAEELISVLSEIPGLRVIARTSSFSFRDQNRDIRKIADSLDVAYVLEGSVRREEGQLRISAQLIDAESNSQLWSRTFDRQFTGIFDIQAEIAHSVAESLHLTLSEPAIQAIEPPRDPNAHESYLLGKFFWHRRAPGDFERCERHYLRAVEIDPGFARAWVGLAGLYWLQAEDPETRKESVRKMGEALEKALKINPYLPEAHARASVYYDVVGDEHRAREHWKQARALGERDWLVLSYMAHSEIRKGNYDRALEFQQKALEINPLSTLLHGNKGGFLMAAGRFAEAMQAFDRAEELNPAGKSAFDIRRTLMLVISGRAEEAVARVQNWPDSLEKDQLLAKSHHALGHDEAAESAIRRLHARGGGMSALRLAEVEAYRGNEDAAFHWLEQIARRASDDESFQRSWLAEVRLSPCLASLRDDPRWRDVITSLPKRTPIDLSEGEVAVSTP